jgi:hypothetical protein
MAGGPLDEVQHHRAVQDQGYLRSDNLYVSAVAALAAESEVVICGPFASTQFTADDECTLHRCPHLRERDITRHVLTEQFIS